MQLRPFVCVGMAALMWPVMAHCAPHVRRVGPSRPAAQPTVMRAEGSGTLSIDFVPLQQGMQILSSQNGGVVNLGKVSYAGEPEFSGVAIKRHPRNFSVETSVGMRIGSATLSGQTAILKAWLETPSDPYKIYLDDVPLTLQPVSVSANAQLGVVMPLHLRIEVPLNTSESQSALQSVISVQVIRN